MQDNYWKKISSEILPSLEKTQEEYKYTNEKKIEVTFKIEGGSPKVVVEDSLHIISRSREIYFQILKKFQESEIDSFIRQTCHDLGKHSHYAFYYKNTDKGNKTTLKKFIDAVDDILPFSASIKKRVYEILKIKAIPNMEEFMEEVKTLFKSAGFQKAFDKVVSTKEPEPFWLLGQYCEEIKDWQNAVICYQEVANLDNTNVGKDASRAIFNIVSRLLEAAQKAQIHLTDEEKQYYLKLQFELQWKNINPDSQDWVDITSHGLSGGKMGEQLLLKNVQPNVDTLFSMMNIIKNLKQKVAALDEKVEKFETENQSQKSNLIKESSDQLFFRPFTESDSTLMEIASPSVIQNNNSQETPGAGIR